MQLIVSPFGSLNKFWKYKLDEMKFLFSCRRHFVSILRTSLFFYSITGNLRENSRIPKNSFPLKKNLHFITDEYRLGPSLTLYPDLPLLHTTVISMALYQTGLSLVQTSMPTVFLEDSSLHRLDHLPVKLKWHRLLPTRLRLVGRTRLQDFGKWS